MWRLVRIAIVWLAAFAIPLQGIAAASMQFCGPNHDRMAVAGVALDLHESHDHADHGAAHTDSAHHGAATTASHGDAKPAHAVKSLDERAKYECNLCAACCASAALPSATASFDPPKVHAVFAGAPTAVSALFLTEGLDRPPRIHLV